MSAEQGNRPASGLAPSDARRPQGRPPLNQSAARAPRAPQPEIEPVKIDVAIEGVTGDAEIALNATAHEGETLEQTIARIRQIRQPFGAMSQKLALPTRSGYHRHWFNDTAGRVDEASASGWAHISNPRDGNPLKRVVGSGRDNGALYAYAMEIPSVFWDEMMDDRHERAQAKIDSIKKNPFAAKAGQAKPSDRGKFYDPHEETGGGPLQVVKG